jgi:hypothetical protein
MDAALKALADPSRRAMPTDARPEAAESAAPCAQQAVRVWSASMTDTTPTSKTCGRHLPTPRAWQGG